MHIKSFKDFIFEAVRDKKVKTAEDIKHKDGSDKDLEKKVKDEMEEVADNCPRCNEHIDDCECHEKDPWSTHVYHRTPKGKEESSEPKQNFNKKQ